MGRVIHFDLVADEPERAIDFYSKTFGWRFDKWEGPMDYWIITTGSDEEPGINGGLSQRNEQNPMLVNTLGVDSLDEALQTVQANGGTVLAPRVAIPGVGWFAQFRDPDANVFGLMEDDPNAR